MLDEEGINKALQEGPLRFEIHEDRLVRVVTTSSFRAALGFVNAVGEIAEAHDHHPDIDIRYSTVILFLSTHDAGGLTELDFTVARAIDKIAVA